MTMKTKIIITLTALLMLTGINANAQNGNLNPSTSPIIGDLNNDNKVNAADVVVLINKLKIRTINEITIRSNGSAIEDINKDGFVNATDLITLVNIIMTGAVEDIKISVIDVTEDTENADIFIYADNGSYILCDGNRENGYSYIHINDNLQSDIKDGIILICDESGIPVIGSTNKGHFIFDNVTCDSYDLTFINNRNEVSLYENIRFDFTLPSINSISHLLDPWKVSWKNLWSGKPDMHNIRLLLPFIVKLASLAFTTVDALYFGGIPGLLNTIASDFYRSSNFENKNLDDFFEGTGVASVAVSYKDPLAYAAYGLDKLAKYLEEKMVYKPGDPEEGKIYLGKKMLEFSYEEQSMKVYVFSKAKWEVDKSNFDESWCEVSASKSQVTIKVKENNGWNDRQCELSFYSPEDKKIEHKTMTIKQEGSKYKLSKKELVFTPAHRSETVYWNTTPSSVKFSCPDWCHVSNIINPLTITVDESSYEARECEIKISAIIEGKKTQRTISVKQIPLCPDTNHPHMIDLGLPSGTKWSCCNAGASSPDKMGNYYSWGNHSPLSYTTGTYFDKDYPYKEWRDLDHDGKPSSTWDEWFIKLDEAYNSATSGSWGNGSMPSTDDYKELVDECKRSNSLIQIGNTNGYYYTAKNGNCIFMPYASSNYWTYSHNNNRAWFFDPSSGGSGGSLGDPEALVNIRSQYCTGRPVRPVSK